MKSHLKSGIVLSLVAISSSAAGYYGSSNLGYGGYPSHKCFKPVKPYDRSEYSVRYYNTQYSIYIDCIRTYVSSAKNDIEEIKSKAKTAIDEANQ